MIFVGYSEIMEKSTTLLEAMVTRREKDAEPYRGFNLRMCNGLSRLKLNELFTLDDNIRGNFSIGTLTKCTFLGYMRVETFAY